MASRECSSPRSSGRLGPTAIDTVPASPTPARRNRKGIMSLRNPPSKPNAKPPRQAISIVVSTQFTISV